MHVSTSIDMIKCLLQLFLYIDMIIYYIKGLNACRSQAKITNVKCICFCIHAFFASFNYIEP